MLHLKSKLIQIVLFICCLLNAEFSKAQNYSLYGMTYLGGSYGMGVLFRYNITTGKDSVLVNFDGTNGAEPTYGSLIQAANGLIYGTTGNGGTYGGGVLFSYNPANGNYNVLVNFNGTNGANPTGDLVQATNGLIYGTTKGGGTYSKGTLFSYDIIASKINVLVNFNTHNPSGGGLIQANNGLLYGVAPTWVNDSSVLFRYKIGDSQDSTLIKYNNPSSDPWDCGLVQANNGQLYITIGAGLLNDGSLHRYNIITKKDSVLVNFNGTDGAGASDGMMQASNGLLYGMLPAGGIYNFNGVNGDGVIFSYNISNGKDSVVLNFDSADGEEPHGRLIQAPNGLLYGMTYYGGSCHYGSSYADGVIFSFNPLNGKDSVLVNFNDTINGAFPFGSLLLAYDTLTGINGVQTNNSHVDIYPNPNDGCFTIDLQSNLNKQLIIQLYNILGEQVYTAILNQGHSKINISNHPAGLYLYRVVTEEEQPIECGRLIIQ